MLIDGKIYLGDEDGDIVIMAEGKVKKVLAEINMGSSVYSTAVPANGVLYISNRNQLYALSEMPGAKPATTDAKAATTTDQPASTAAKPSAAVTKPTTTPAAKTRPN
jgi:outer membrane protein assembly factor BamB